MCTLIYIYIYARTLQRFSIKWEGVRLFNSIPISLRKWTGTKETFKNMLDKFLENIPDQPEIEGYIPGGKTLNGEASNSIADWTRILGLEDMEDDLEIEIDGNNQTIPELIERDDNSIMNSNIVISMGSGHSPDHSQL